MSSELWQYSATELAKMIRNKDVTSEEVVEDHLKRIEEVNPKLNAITAVLEESALSEREGRINRTGGTLAWSSFHGERKHRFIRDSHYVGYSCWR